MNSRLRLQYRKIENNRTQIDRGEAVIVLKLYELFNTQCLFMAHEVMLCMYVTRCLMTCKFLFLLSSPVFSIDYQNLFKTESALK